MRKVRFVAAHRGDAESFRKSPLYAGIGEREPLFVRLNNSEGLSHVYNLYLDGAFDQFASFGPEPPEHLEDDIAVFVHDDVEVIGNNVSAELNRWAGEGYAIMGLAGTSTAVIGAPALWHRMSEKGCESGLSVFHIAHRDPATGQPVLNREQPYSATFGPLREVVLLDGLFLAVDLQAVNAANWRFDERFTFHHYDLASCLGARAAGLRLRTVFVPVIHWSSGLKPHDRQFELSQETFLQAFAPDGPRAVWC